MPEEYDLDNCVEIGHAVCVVAASDEEQAKRVCLTHNDMALGGPEEAGYDLMPATASLPPQEEDPE